MELKKAAMQAGSCKWMNYLQKLSLHHYVFFYFGRVQKFLDWYQASFSMTALAALGY